LVKRKQVLEKAHQEVLSIEQTRIDHSTASPGKVAKIPVSDSDARVLKNKEGGYAPNYTPVVTTDSEAGFIVSEGVTNSTAEYTLQQEAVQDIQNTFGTSPEYMLGDGLYSDLETIKYLESHGITPLSPAKSTGAIEGDAAYRHDPKLPVEPHRIADLPVSKRSKNFTRKAFMFDLKTDSFYCPMGKRLTFRHSTNHKRSPTKTSQTRVYYAKKKDCAECPLRDRCISRKNKQPTSERPVLINPCKGINCLAR